MRIDNPEIIGGITLPATSSGHFSGSFEGDGSQLTGIVATVLDIDTFGDDLTSNTLAGTDKLILSDGGTEGRVNVSQLASPLAGTGLEANSGVIRIAAAAAGDGLSGGAGSALAVNVDDSTIETNAGTLRIKDDGVTNAKLANDSITIAGASTALGGTISADTIAGQISADTIANSQLANDSITIAGTATALGGTISADTIAGQISADTITNSQLANDSITFGNTARALGSTITTISGLTLISADTGTFVHQIFESASTIVTSGSNIFGNDANDIQQITGSLLQSGSAIFSGSLDVAVGTISGSFRGDGSALTGVAPLAGTGITVIGTTVSIGQAVETNSNLQFNSLGIGTAAPGTTGLIRATNDVVAYYSSDERLKDNIQPIEDALGKVEAMGGYSFDWNDKQEVYEGHDVGVIAQEVQAVLPELVETRDSGFLAVKYEKLTAVLIEAVKELSARVKELENK